MGRRRRRRAAGSATTSTRARRRDTVTVRALRLPLAELAPLVDAGRAAAGRSAPPPGRAPGAGPRGTAAAGVQSSHALAPAECST